MNKEIGFPVTNDIYYSVYLAGAGDGALLGDGEGAAVEEGADEGPGLKVRGTG